MLRTVVIIFYIILQTILIAQMLSIGGEGTEGKERGSGPIILVLS